MKYTIEQLRKALENKKYKFFESKGERPYNVNIIGVRHDNHMNNEFNDLMYLIFSSSTDGPLEIHEYHITTDPGTTTINDPDHYNKAKTGTAILVPGQYLSVYNYSQGHQGYYQLRQVLGDVWVYRDTNKSKVIENMEKFKGRFEINIHRSSATSSRFVNNWSAGCQVFQSADDFDHFIQFCKLAKENHGNHFTYTLITEADIPKS